MATGKKNTKRLSTTASKNTQTNDPSVQSQSNSSQLSTPFADVWSETCSTVHKAVFKWTINNFSTYFCNGSPALPYIFSEKFTPPTNKRLLFSVKVCPKGETEFYKDFISIYLFLNTIEKDPTRRIRFSVSILKDDGEKYITENMTSTLNTGCGWAKYIYRTALFDKANRLLPDDKLTIFCEVFVYSKEYNVSKRASKDVRIASKLAQAQLSNDFEQLLADANVQSDIVLRVGHCVGSKDFAAHKAILSARSPVFRAMLQHDTKEAKQNLVEITDVNAKVFEDLLRYIYTGKVTENKVTLDLLTAADKYQLDSLKSMCEHILGILLDIESVAKTFSLADIYSANHLKMHCIKFINGNTAQLILTDAWKQLCSSRPELLVQLYQDKSNVSKVQLIEDDDDIDDDDDSDD